MERPCGGQGQLKLHVIHDEDIVETDVDRGESGGKRNVHHSTFDVCT